MSLKRFAMLSTISYHNQQNNGKNNNNTNNNNIKAQTTFATTTRPESTTKVINSNKSTLIQLKQQQQQQEQQSQQVIAPLFLGNNTPTPTTTTTRESSSWSTLLFTQSNVEKDTTTATKYNANHKLSGKYSDDLLNDIIGEESAIYDSESSETFDTSQLASPGHPPVSTYTSTTYYGSGLGVFHQQNTRSNAGGSSNGLGGGSYSNGINNNVNLLLLGAMLTLLTTIVCVVCYCCHRNIKKRTEAAYRQQRQWLENDPNMEIYSVEQCYETSGLFVSDSMDGLATIPALHHEPPPSYDAVVAMQEQQQLLMQQQQFVVQQQMLQQQLPATNSPPPGYRSSLDVSAMIQQNRRTVLGVGLTAGGSIVSGMEINSLASSAANLRTPSSISPLDPMLNYNDANGNMTLDVPVSTATPTNNRTAASYLRNKHQQQQQQQQRNVGPHQMSQSSMKMVLQAQSCCSLQRAEVENMWNAAAAALAARSAHLSGESRASTTASVSSPTLAISTRKPLNGCKSSNSNTPETFGGRYLKQNYYRRGCPLCGKFRYDDSSLTISIESNLDTLACALTEESSSDGRDVNVTSTQNNGNNNEIRTNAEDAEENKNFNNEAEISDMEVDKNDNAVEQQCSCGSTKHKNEINSTPSNSYQNLNCLHMQTLECNDTVPTTTDDNANTALTTERQSINQTASNNNNEIASNEESLDLPSTSAAANTTLPRSPVTAAPTSSAASTPSTAIDLDCINENGIISLDMSKIIDKTGLPTYDGALKLESSGYV